MSAEGRYPGFHGVAGRDRTQSRPWWAPRPAAPAGAPNIVVILADDLGFADIGCYGSEIETPQLDRLAAEGVRYAQFHSTPMCTPTRAALLTGMNAHAAGAGAVALDDAGFPGYRGRIADDVLSAAEVFRANGYVTLMLGKWHLSPRSDLRDGSSKDSWPLQRGFDRYYGFNEPIGYTNFHHPHRLFEDNHVVEVDAYPDDYYLTDDLTTRAIAMIRSIKATDPGRPFFMHFAHGATHGPHMAKPADMAKYRGRYAAGWDVLREWRFAKQLELGVIAPGTRLSPWPKEEGWEVPEWSRLSADDQKVFARYMEVYAGMVDNIDQNLGRLRSALEELGQWDNTVVIFTSDNGATGPRPRGILNTVVGPLGNSVGPSELDCFDLIGGPRLLPHYARGWSMVGNTPFRLQKMTTFAGGHQVPFILTWPAGVPERGVIRNHYAHIRDVLPTLLELTGAKVPDARNGQPARPMTGASFVSTLMDAAAGPTRSEQYYEIWGHRGYYRRGWESLTLHRRGQTFSDSEWELYHLEQDPTELDNLATAEADRLTELVRAFDEAAWENQVYPLSDALPMAMSGPHSTRPFSVLIRPATPTLEPHFSRALVQGRSVTITLRFAIADGEEGVLLSHGDQGGGYLLGVESGELFCYYRAGRETVLRGGPLAPGDHVVVAELLAQPGGFCEGRLSVEGEVKAIATELVLFTAFSPFEGIDVGCDRRSPVWWELRERRGTFPFNGTLESVHYAAGDHAVDAPERRAAEHREQMQTPDSVI